VIAEVSRVLERENNACEGVAAHELDKAVLCVGPVGVAAVRDCATVGAEDVGDGVADGGEWEAVCKLGLAEEVICGVDVCVAAAKNKESECVAVARETDCASEGVPNEAVTRGVGVVLLDAWAPESEKVADE
jgi:hypothetical protein